MKKLSSLLITFIVFSPLFFSCISDKTSEEKKEPIKVETKALKKGVATLDGEFIHVDTAAVLKVKNKLYGVMMDDMAKEAIKKTNAIKTDDYDVINVTIKAEINPNPEEGWDEIVTIKSLDKVYKPQLTKEAKVLEYSSNK